MRWLLLSTLLVQSATAQSEADKLEAALKKFGERTYRMSEAGTEVGTVTLRSKVRKEGDRKVAVLEAEFKVKVEEMEAAMTFVECADLDGLKFLSARRSGNTPDRKLDSHVTVKEGKALLKDGDAESSHAIGKETTGDLASVWLVCAAEQKKDAAFKLDVLNLAMPGHEPGHVFACLGKETIEIGGKKVEAFKWVEKGEWKHSIKVGGKDFERNSKVENHYWVNPEGYLVRFTSGRTEATLDAK